jgi:hypothetical protein
MRKRLVVISLVAGLLVTGCSSNNSTEPKYDKVDLIKYEQCLSSNSDGLLAVLTVITRQGNFDYQRVLDLCKKFEPKPLNP